MEILFIIVALWLMNDAMTGYKAARHAQKVVYNRDLSFIDYMVMNHPIMTICIAILLLLAVIAIFIYNAMLLGLLIVVFFPVMVLAACLKKVR